MATKRRLDIEIGSEAKGSGFKDTGKDADKLGDKLKGLGDDAKKGFGGVDDEADKLGGKLRSAGKKAGDQLQSGLSSGMSGMGDAISGGLDIGSVADSIGGALEGLGGTLGPAGAAAGVAVAGAFAVGFADGLELEQANDKLAAQLGLTGPIAAEYGDLASEIYRGAWGDSIGEVNEALGAVHSSLADGLGPGEDALKRATTQALDLAEAFDVDVTDAVHVAGLAVRQGLAADADEAFDLMTAAMQKMPAGMREELIPAIEEYGGFLADLGFTGEEAFGLLASASLDGSYGIDKTADALKELTIRSTDMSTASVDAFKAAGLNADDMAARFLEGGDSARGALGELVDGLLSIEDPVARSNAAIALFGTPLEDLSVTEIPTFLSSLTGMETSLGDTATAAEDMGDTLNNNAATKIEEFKRGALGALTDFVGGSVIPKLQEFAGWARDNPGAFQVIATVIGVVLVGAFIALGIAAAQAAIAVLAATWPIVLVVMAVIAIAALLVIHWDTLAAAAGVAWEFIKNAAMSAYNWLKTNWPLVLAILTGPFGLAVLLIVKNWETIKTAATGALAWIGARALGAKNTIVGAFNSVVSFVSGLPGRITTAASGMWDGIKNSFRSVLNAIIGWWNGLSFTLPTITIPSWDPPGPGPTFGGGTIGGQTFSTPDIAMLAEGGVVRATPGGVLALLGEGGHDERVEPLSGPHAPANNGGDIYYIDMDMRGAVIAGEREFEALVVDAWNKAVRNGGQVNIVDTAVRR